MKATREQIISELWRRGDTEHRLHGGQLVINKAYENSFTSRLFVAECARQFGKTSWGAWLADVTARKNAGCQIRIATAFHTDLSEFILPAFRWLFLDCPQELQPRYLSQKSKFVYSNGSEITLVGLDRNPNKLRGNRLRLILVEEAGFSDSETLRYVYESVIAPAMLHEKLARVILISTPPESGNDHAFCQLADEANLNGAYIKLTIYENPLLDETAINRFAESLGGKESVAFRREALCERIIDKTKAIIPEFLESHVKETKRPEYFNFLHTYVWMDIGSRDFTAIGFGYYDFPRATLVIEDELTIRGSDVNTRNIKKLVEGKEKELGYFPYRRIADNNNLVLLQDLSLEGISFTPTSKDSLHAMVNSLRLGFKDQRVEINPRCKTLIGTIKSGLWNKDKSEFKRSKLYGHCDHLAGLIYGWRNLDTNTNPIPVYHQNPWLQNKQQTSPAAKALKNAFQTR